MSEQKQENENNNPVTTVKKYVAPSPWLIWIGIGVVLVLWLIMFAFSFRYDKSADQLSFLTVNTLALLSFAVVFVSALTGIRQWEVMVNQEFEMTKQRQAMIEALERTDKLLIQNEQIIEISQRQTLATEQTLRESVITRIIENSPFVAPSGVKLATPPLMPDIPHQRITLRITNIGKSPALNVKFRRQYTIADIPMQDFEPAYDERPPKESSFIAPGGEILVSYRLPLLILDELERIDDGIDFIYIWGLFEYKDIFGRDHWTQYCMRYRAGSAAFDTCPNGNSCDYEYQPDTDKGQNPN